MPIADGIQIFGHRHSLPGHVMNVCIDARWIFDELTGIGLYTQELIRALARVDQTNEYLLLFGSETVMDRTIAECALRNNSGFRFQVSSFSLFSLRNQVLLPSLLNRENIDIYHSTNYMMPLRAPRRAKRVVTIHDLIPLLFRDHAPKAKKARLFPIYKRLMREVGARADVIIAVSESTKADIVRELRAPADKVIVTHEGVTPAHRPLVPRPSSATPRILFVGRRDPYKNLPRLIEAFGGLRRQGVHARLRVIGPEDARYPEARDWAKALQINDDIDWLGYVSPERLIEEYQQADVFALPSRYEGFGLTVLEAMACGAPVVCSNTSSLPEVAGDAALLVDPSSTAALTDALRRVLTDRHLAATLREKGLRRAAAFTWDATAQKTLGAYRRALRL